ncbi:MAG: autotransporter assembly complex protein TamA [Thiolinea sp.]
MQRIFHKYCDSSGSFLYLVSLLACLVVPTGMALAAEEEVQAAAEESPVKVDVSGASEALANNLKAHLPSLRNLSCESDQERVDRFIDASADKLIEGADAMGYFSAQFNMTAQRQSSCWRLNIAVKPGSPVRVRNIKVQVTGAGSNLEDFRKIRSALPYKQGDILVTSPYEDFKSSLSSTASRLGFFDAEFVKRQIAVNIDARTADIELHFETGKRYQIGVVTVEQDVLDDRHLQRFLRVKQGQIYDSDVLLQQRRLLESSGYYKDVQVNSQFSKAEGSQVPVKITAVRRKRYTYTANIGYATDTNVRLEAGMDVHWVNQRGHKLGGKLRLSQKDPAIGMTYKVPLWNPEHEYASFAVDWSRSDNDDIKGEKLELELNYNRRNKNDWQQTAFVSFLNEKTQVQGAAANTSQLTLIGGRVNKTLKDDALFPTKGWRVQAEVKGAHDSLLSDQSLLQGSIDGKYLYTFEHKGKLILRGELGASWTDEFDDLPKSLRFFAGGQSSVRGFNSESIGERDTDGNVVGGKNLMVASAEYEYPFTEKISGAVFVDAGSAFDEWDDYGFEVGVGIGARYRSPLGPVRVDFAIPENDTSDLHFYFSLGPDL